MFYCKFCVISKDNIKLQLLYFNELIYHATYVFGAMKTSPMNHINWNYGANLRPTSKKNNSHMCANKLLSLL